MSALLANTMLEQSRYFQEPAHLLDVSQSVSDNVGARDDGI